MKPDSQRIAIAEACGWGNIAFNRGWIKSGDGETQCVIPDYLKDLNAMHEAEKVFEGYGMRQSYRRNLLIACDTTELNEVISATAAQRAEAFLLTIGKWEGAK